MIIGMVIVTPRYFTTIFRKILKVYTSLIAVMGIYLITISQTIMKKVYTSLIAVIAIYLITISQTIMKV
jgi:hypothetical protein